MYTIPTTCQIPDLNKLYVEYFGYPSSGFFVEVGAFDGESFSNTSCLADHGWEGIYIEPIKRHFQSCKQRHKSNRVQTINCAIGTLENEITIFDGGPLTTSDPAQVRRYGSISWAKDVAFKAAKCKQLRLDTLLELHGVQRGFALLVVDVEGREDDVFNSFDLAYWRPTMMIVELEDQHEAFAPFRDHVAEHKALRSTILEHGYVELYKDHINTVFLQNASQRCASTK